MHILLLSCSAKKSTSCIPVAAIDLYQGVFFSVLKKAIREHHEIKNRLKILIVSAKYGLICAEDEIVYYELKMTREIAASQVYLNTKKLNEIICNTSPESITVVMGKTYLDSIDFSQVSIPVHFIKGEIGIMLHGLKSWLNQLIGSDEYGN